MDRNGSKTAKPGLKQGKKKMSKLTKRSASSNSSKKDNLHNPGPPQEDLSAEQLAALSEQAQLFMVTSTKQLSAHYS